MKFSLTRGLILSVIKKNEPISITNLSKKTGISMGTTIYRYLNELESKGLIVMKQEKKARGKPTMISTTSKAKPFPEEVMKWTTEMFLQGVEKTNRSQGQVTAILSRVETDKKPSKVQNPNIKRS